MTSEQPEKHVYFENENYQNATFFNHSEFHSVGKYLFYWF